MNDDLNDPTDEPDDYQPLRALLASFAAPGPTKESAMAAAMVEFDRLQLGEHSPNVVPIDTPRRRFGRIGWAPALTGVAAAAAVAVFTLSVVGNGDQTPTDLAVNATTIVAANAEAPPVPTVPTVAATAINSDAADKAPASLGSVSRELEADTAAGSAPIVLAAPAESENAGAAGAAATEIVVELTTAAELRDRAAAVTAPAGTGPVDAASVDAAPVGVTADSLRCATTYWTILEAIVFQGRPAFLATGPFGVVAALDTSTCAPLAIAA